MNKLRVGVVGCGQLARIAHIPLLERNPAVELVGLCDPDSTAINACALLAPAATRYASTDALFDTHSVDAVVIALPSHLHTDAAVTAFRHGAHVYLEKPVASQISDAQRIIEACRQSNRVGMIGQNFRFNPLAKKLRDLVAAGSIGDVVSVVTHYATPRPPADSWRRNRSTGGGALLDLAVHHIDFARFALDAGVASVSARIESRESEHDFAELSLTMSNGAVVIINVEFGDSFRDRIEVHGEKATLWIDRTHSVDVGRSSAGRAIGFTSKLRAHFPTPARVAYWALRRRSPFHEPSYAIALSTFVDAVMNGVRPAPDLNDGLAALAVVDASERSSESQQPVSVGYPGNSLA